MGSCATGAPPVLGPGTPRAAASDSPVVSARSRAGLSRSIGTFDNPSGGLARTAQSEELTVLMRRVTGPRATPRKARSYQRGMAAALPGTARPGRGSAMFDQEIVFTTGRAAFFALNGIVVLLIAVYVAARWR